MENQNRDLAQVAAHTLNAFTFLALPLTVGWGVLAGLTLHIVRTDLLTGFVLITFSTACIAALGATYALCRVILDVRLFCMLAQDTTPEAMDKALASITNRQPQPRSMTDRVTGAMWWVKFLVYAAVAQWGFIILLITY